MSDTINDTDANTYEPNNPYVNFHDGFEFMPRLDDACRYSTIYRDGKPVGTLQRRGYLDPKTDPIWRLYATDGTALRRFYLGGRYVTIAKLSARGLWRYLAGE